MKRRYYIAYGSNLNMWQMQERCPDATAAGTALLEGWRLAYRGSKTGAFLTILRDGSGSVPVAIWAVSQRDEKALDRYEGFPTFYGKKTLKVTMTRPDGSTQDIDAFVYIMNANSRPGLPSRYYIQTCMTGYRHFGFSTEYLKEAYDNTLTEVMAAI